MDNLDNIIKQNFSQDIHFKRVKKGILILFLLN
jgi:hypothetical protein